MKRYFDLVEEDLDPLIKKLRLVKAIRVGVFGWGRHGKDTFSEFLGLPYKSSSEFANEYCVWPGWGEDRYDTIEDCFDDRANHRTIWHQRISAFNSPDKASLARMILKDNQVYCGMRCKEELKACYDADLYDVTFWVDRSEHLPPEPIESCNVTPDMCDVVIDNNHDLQTLKLQADLFIDMIKSGGIKRINREDYFS